jgi:uncharacterized protein YcfJ
MLITMARNRKRKGHPFRKSPDIPANERVKGKTFWAILFAVFGLIIGFLVGGGDIIIIALSALGGGLIGYLIGKSMEESK